MSPTAPARAALGVVPGRLSRGVRAPQRPAAPAAAAGGGLGNRRLMGRAASGPGNPSALEVFVDDEFGELQDTYLLHGAPASAPQGTFIWNCSPHRWQNSHEPQEIGTGSSWCSPLACKRAILGYGSWLLDATVCAWLARRRLELTAQQSRCCVNDGRQAASSAAGGSGENAALTSTSVGRSAPSAWATLDGFEATRKENERAPSRWSGVRLPQSRGVAAGPVPEPIEIPVDDELAELPTPTKGRAAPQARPNDVSFAQVAVE